MTNCINCGAPLPKDSIVCAYCKTRNAIDLHGVAKGTVDIHESDRICPRCDKPLQTIDLKLEGQFLIEKCDECMGLFFDPGELEALLDKSVSNVFHVDNRQLEKINAAKRHEDFGVTYIKCPICRKLMHRLNFGSRSGVIVDTCKDHGIWLDGGELRHLMEWTKSGGVILDQKAKLEEERMKLEAERRAMREKAMQGRDMGQYDHNRFHGHGYGYDDYGPDGGDLLNSVSRIVRGLFSF